MWLCWWTQDQVERPHYTKRHYFKVEFAMDAIWCVLSTCFQYYFRQSVIIERMKAGNVLKIFLYVQRQLKGELFFLLNNLVIIRLLTLQGHHCRQPMMYQQHLTSHYCVKNAAHKKILRLKCLFLNTQKTGIIRNGRSWIQSSMDAEDEDYITFIIRVNLKWANPSESV